MRRFQCALLTAIAVIGFASVASAADMPVKGPVYKAPPAAPVPYTWTGLYVGLNGGYGWGGSQDWSAGTFPIGSGNLRGGLFGGQIGYNWQANDRFVFGVQADGDWADITGLATASPEDGRCGNNIGDQTSDCRTKVKALATLTGRVGYLPWENTLVYAKAGIAWASIDFTVNNVIDITGGTCGPIGTNQGGYNTNNHTRTAFTAGAGVEQRVWDRVSVFGEYDYVDLRGTTTDLNTGGTGAGGCTPNFTSTTNYKADNIFRLGVNVKLW